MKDIIEIISKTLSGEKYMQFARFFGSTAKGNVHPLSGIISATKIIILDLV